MRRDYVEPDDFEYEPTPHDEVLKRAEAHRAASQGRRGAPGNDCDWNSAREASRKAGTGRR